MFRILYVRCAHVPCDILCAQLFHIQVYYCAIEYNCTHTHLTHIPFRRTDSQTGQKDERTWIYYYCCATNSDLDPNYVGIFDEWINTDGWRRTESSESVCSRRMDLHMYAPVIALRLLYVCVALVFHRLNIVINRMLGTVTFRNWIVVDPNRSGCKLQQNFQSQILWLWPEQKVENNFLLFLFFHEQILHAHRTRCDTNVVCTTNCRSTVEHRMACEWSKFPQKRKQRIRESHNLQMKSLPHRRKYGRDAKKE